MAGILAPSIGDIGAAPAGVAPVVNKSAATAVQGIDNLLRTVVSGLGKGGGEVSSTAGEREDAKLKVFADEAIRIEGLISGGLGSRQAEVLIRQNRLAANSTLPGSTTKINSLLDSIHGTDTNIQEIDPETLRTNAVNEFFSSPEGAGLLPSTFVPDGQGGLDVEATRRKMDAKAQMFFAQDAQDAVAADNLARAKVANELNNEAAKEISDEFNFRAISEANDILAGLATASDIQGLTVESEEFVSSAILSIIEQRDMFAARMATRAAKIGLTNEPESYNPEDALKPFNDRIEFMRLVQGEPIIQQNVIRAKGENAVAKFYLDATGFFPGEKGQEYLAALLGDVFRPDLMVAISAFTKDRKSGNPTLKGLSALPAGTDSPSEIDPAFSEAAASLPSFEQKTEVRNKLDAFYLSDGYKGNDPIVRQKGIDFFSEAVGVMQATGQDISETTFDKAYRPEFIDMFAGITSVPDTLTEKFSAVVREHLTTVFSQQDTVTKFTINNEFASDYPGLRVKLDGSSFDLDFGTQAKVNIGPDSKTTTLTSLLAEQGLPVSMQGLERLIATPPSKIGLGTGNSEKVLVIGDAKRMVRILKPKLKYLNKIQAVASALKANVTARFPDVDISNLADTQGTARFDAPVAITSRREFEALPMGATYTWTDEDGVHTEVKGQ